MKLVVTGALGHIGSALLRSARLPEHFDEVVLLDNLSTQRYASLFELPRRPKFLFIQGDLEQSLTDEVMNGASAVIHLAGYTDAAISFGSEDLHYANNFRITEHVVRLSARHGVHLIYPSSTSVYTPAGSMADETSTELFPTSPYSKCKLDEERLIQEGLPVQLFTIFRLGTIFGPSPGMRFHTAVNKFCWQAATGQPIEVWETALEQKRPYLLVDDAVACMLERAVRGSDASGITNILSCNSTVADVLGSIRDYGLNFTVKLVKARAMNSLSYTIDDRKARVQKLPIQGSLHEGVFSTLALFGSLTSHSQIGEVHD